MEIHFMENDGELKKDEHQKYYVILVLDMKDKSHVDLPKQNDKTIK